MALVSAERSASKSRAIANSWTRSRGALLILNLLLYLICPVSAVAAHPQHQSRGAPYSDSTIVRLPKWNTSFIANSSLSTWGNNFTSGSRLVTIFSIATGQGAQSSSQLHGFLSASHRPHNITALPSSANVTYRRDSTRFISPSHSRYLNLSDQEVTKTRHSTNITSAPIRLSSNSTQTSHGASSSMYSVSNTFRPSSLGRNTTRANDITKAAVSFAQSTSISPSISPFTLPSSSSLRSHPSMTPLSTSSPPKLSRTSSFPSKTRFALPSASSSTTPSQSSLTSITPKASTSNSSVTSGLSLSTNELPFSLPPGCRFTAWRNETYVIIPTERARKVPQQRLSPSRIPQAGAEGYDDGPSPTISPAGAEGYDDGPPPSTTSQAGAQSYDNGVEDPQEPKSLDQKVVDKSPSVKTTEILLGTILGIVPGSIAVSTAFYKFSMSRLEKKKNGQKNPAEEARDVVEAVKKGKWTKRVASWFKDFNEFFKPVPLGKNGPAAWPNAGERLMLQELNGPTFDNDVEEPFERDPGSCNYDSHTESQGCVEPPGNWPTPASSEGEPPRLTHEESLKLAEELPPVEIATMVNYDVPWRILRVPDGYQRLTLDGKIAYLAQNKINNADPGKPPVRLSPADPRISYLDDRCAAVGPGNSPLGGENVDKIWVDREGRLTLNGERLGLESDIVQQCRMLRFEDARFVRQNFPLDRFEGGSLGSPYSPETPADDGNGADGSGGDDSGGDRTITPSNPGGNGKGKAKAQSIEDLEKGLSFAQKQAMDLQMDHDLLDVKEQDIRNWRSYWVKNIVKGPGPGDYDAWRNRFRETLPQIDQTNLNPEQNGDANDGQDAKSKEEAKSQEEAKSKEEAMREQMRKIDEALRKEKIARQEQEKRIKESEARSKAIREQMQKADEAMKEDGKTREEEARIRNDRDRKAEKALRDNKIAKAEAIRKWKEAQAQEAAWEHAKEKELAKEREYAKQRSSQGRKSDGKGNGGR